MSNWQEIPDDGCVIVRRPNSRGGWSVMIAYKAKNRTWRCDGGNFTEVRQAGYDEWCEIPK